MTYPLYSEQGMGTPQRKALCIGVAYTQREDDGYHLKAPHRDALRIKNKLEVAYNYNVEILLDKESYIFPTRDNIKAAIGRLVEGAQPGDRLFFHFSGHGDQIENLDHKEADGLDELILPCDYDIDKNFPVWDRNRYPVEGRILDDRNERPHQELHEWLVKPIPPGCYLNALFDSCHSGTVLDLRYRQCCHPPEQSPFGQFTTSYEEADGVLVESPSQKSAPRPRAENEARSRQNSLIIDSATGFGCSIVHTQGISKRKSSILCGRLVVREESSPVSSPLQGGNVFSWCACSDAQKAGENDSSGEPSGFMVEAFLNTLNENPTPTYEQMLIALNKRVRKKCENCKPPNGGPVPEQDPELGSNLPLDMNAAIVL